MVAGVKPFWHIGNMDGNADGNMGTFEWTYWGASTRGEELVVDTVLGYHGNGSEASLHNMSHAYGNKV